MLAEDCSLNLCQRKLSLGSSAACYIFTKIVKFIACIFSEMLLKCHSRAIMEKSG
jgi:hypothetical protein